ncbi:hypothetical protein JYU34_012085 [Plutella xylostella]|uniref:Protein sleepless n=1 Tax=Plutella xylostella TaxID=51655 RepID=A0ABQ7QEA6_PLUXY|nr:hypothetical protein JYU34_012085 [Plutella xylostella]
MELPVFLLVFSSVFKISHAQVRCYKCEPLSNNGIGVPPCEHFDHSARYQATCPDSTVCLKRRTSLRLADGQETHIEVRDCAPQTLSGNQEKVGRSWRPVNRIYEAYEDSCTEDKSEGRPTVTVSCFCHGDFCNSSCALSVTTSLVVMCLASLWFALQGG